MNSGSKTVYLCGAGGKGNVGAEAIALAIIGLFQRRYSSMRFLVSAWYPDRMRELLSRIPGDFSLVRQESLLDNPLNMASADFFVICGDVSISETVVSILPLYYALRTATASLAGSKVVFLGIEAEKISRLSNVCGLKWLVDRPSNSLVLRNRESLANLQEIPMRKARLLLGSEPTLSLDKGDVGGFEYENSLLSPSKLRVGFGVRDYFTEPFRVSLLSRKLVRKDRAPQQARDVMRRVTEFTARLADYMAGQHDAQIIFIPHHYLPESERIIRPDSEVAESIIERCQTAQDVVIVEDCLHPFTVIDLYSKLDLVFSMRHHANAFAYLNGVPTFGYNLYPKIQAFFAQTAREDMLLDPFVSDMSETYAKIDSVMKYRESISRELKAGLALLRSQMTTAMDLALNDKHGPPE